MALAEGSHSTLQPLHGFVVVVLAAVLFPFVYYASCCIYNVYFHPLSKYPGPRIAAATTLWYARSQVRGTTPIDILNLHNQYGEVVRVAPNELSYVNPSAWKEIYGHKAPGQPEFPKDEKYHSSFGGEPTLLNANREYHAALRKLLAHGFSDKALREQESIIQVYVDTMMKKLHEDGQNGRKPLDMTAWYNFFTFDVIGFLTYGETFDCLTSSHLHAWIELFFTVAKFHALNQAIGRIPRFLQSAFKMWVIPKQNMSNFKMVRELTKEKVERRLEIESTVPDFMFKLNDAYRSGKLSFGQLSTNASILIGAGSETTATLLSGITHFLTTHPAAAERLTGEIRETFKSPEEITMTGVNKCRYLLACLEEALRIYPPSPATHARIAPPEGAILNGKFVPGGTAVGIAIHAICNSPLNFQFPDMFIPERWMGEDPAFDDDKKEAAQAFSFGPRNCIGRNLAYVEMKLVIARLLWHFDLENCTQGDWLDQKIFMVWDKAPLMIKLKPVKRE